MTRLPLHLCYTETPQRQPAAWLIAGPHADQWLDEMLGWHVPLTEVMLYVVPRSAGDRTPHGALAVVGKERMPKVSRRCQPYGRIDGTRIYLPIEARLEPDVTAAELAELLEPLECVHVWHPASGLVCFEAASAHRVVDLFEPFAPDGASWGCAEPGVTLSARLLSIEAEVAPTAQMVIDEGRGDIGTDAPGLKLLPPRPDEPDSGALGRAGRALQRQFARLVQKLARKPRKQGGAKRQPGRLGQWAQRQLARLEQVDLARRHREILRLMHLLKTNPDEGLRYALPLADQRRPGGRSGSQLPPRDTDFSLSRLGSGSGDPWHLPPNYRAQLLNHYHTLASRELRLGRHRRAAYIYAELLGNLDMAAAALKSGRHWREAAVLYRDRLHRPAEAARCLEEGGLWIEAIRLYEELRQFEKAGDLYARIDQADNARHAYGRAVDELRTQHDYVSAAKLLETKLADPDAAVACLDAGWPASSQAFQCLSEQFQLLGRLGRHAASSERVEQLRQPPDGVRPAAVVELLSQVATAYPDAAVRAAAADTTRILAARALPSASLEQAQQLLAGVRRLVPSERLLGRDCDRYLRLRAEPPRRPPAQRKPAPTNLPPLQPQLIRQFHLARDVEWQRAVSAGSVFYAAGFREGRLIVEQCSWEEHRGTLEVDWPARMVGQRGILMATGTHEGPLIVYSPSGPPLASHAFPANDDVPVEVIAGTPPWLPQVAVAVQQTAGGTTHVITLGVDGLVLHAYGAQGEPLGSRYFHYSDICRDEFEKNRPLLPLPFHARDRQSYFALDNRLVIVRQDGKLRHIDLPGPIIGLTGSAPFSNTRVAIAMELGAVLYWDDFQEQTTPFATELVAPVLQFIEGGWLVAAAAQQCQVYRTGELHRIQCEAVFSYADRDIIAVLGTAHRDEFALVAADGEMSLYRVPRRT